MNYLIFGLFIGGFILIYFIATKADTQPLNYESKKTIKVKTIKVKKTKAPDWFTGTLSEKGDTIKFKGKEFELSALELSIYTLLIVCYLEKQRVKADKLERQLRIDRPNSIEDALEGFSSSTIKGFLKEENLRIFDEKLKILIEKCTKWFRIENPEFSKYLIKLKKLELEKTRN